MTTRRSREFKIGPRRKQRKSRAAVDYSFPSEQERLPLPIPGAYQVAMGSREEIASWLGSIPRNSHVIVISFSNKASYTKFGPIFWHVARDLPETVARVQRRKFEQLVDALTQLWPLAATTALGDREPSRIAIVRFQDHQRHTGIRSRRGSMPGILSERVILIEGDADEIVPNAELASDMHGFVIMTPPGEQGKRLLDMLWRITMAYAGKPGMLRSRTTVRKMIEAVWSKESRELAPARPPTRKSGQADRAQHNDLALSKVLQGRAPSSNAKLRRAPK